VRCAGKPAVGPATDLPEVPRRRTAQSANLHVLAFRLAEEPSLPVMVCMDGFVLTTPRRRASTTSCTPIRGPQYFAELAAAVKVFVA
jgi:pyruvate/2-oxoacid:ferredoxin oxidoreductase alpha subunit